MRAYDPAAGEPARGSLPGLDVRRRRRTTRPPGADVARAAHRVGRVPLARLRPGARRRWRAPRGRRRAQPARPGGDAPARVRVRGRRSLMPARRRHRRRRVPRVAPLRRCCSARGGEVVAVDNLSPVARDNVDAPRSTDPASTLVEHDVIDGIPVDGRGRRRAALREPGEPARVPRACRSRRSRSARSARAARSTSRARTTRASCSRRRARSTATRSCTRSPRATAATSTRSARASVYDEAKRFAETITMAYHRAYGARHEDRAHLQHLRPAPAAGRRSGRVELPRAGDATASRSRSTATARRPVRSATSTTRSRGILALLDSDHVGPVNIGNPDEFTMLELADARARGHRLDVRDRVRAAARSAIPTQRRPDITLARASCSAGSRRSTSAKVSRRTHDWYLEERPWHAA